MDWFNELVAKHTTEGIVDSAALTAEFPNVFPHHAVPKAVFNERGDALKEAKAALIEAQKSTGDVDAIKAQLAEAQKKAEEAEAAMARTAREAEVREALRSAGGTDIDYLVYRLGDADGDIGNRVKDLKASMPSFFDGADQAPSEGQPPGAAGYTPIDNKLPDGQNKTDIDTAREQIAAGFGLTSPPTK